MKHKKIIFLSAFAVVGLAVSFIASAADGIAFEAVFASTGNYSTSASTYYNGITATSGTSLMGQLHDLITTTHKTYTTYSDCSNATTVYATDPGTSSSYVRDFYTQNNIAKAWGSGAVGTWNREHVWCQSLSNSLWGTSGGGSDLHHLRPLESTLNSTRNNNPYGDVTPNDSTTVKYAKNTSGSYITAYPGGYLSGGVWEPIDSVKGDVARILMYTYVHYSKYSNVSGSTNGSGSSSYFGTLNITSVVSANSASAAWSLLLNWNSLDPIDASERTRNEAVAKFQGNRNPFIDNSTYADAIWGGGTSNPASIAISATSKSLVVGNTTTINATSSNASSITWSTSNSSVASISSTSASSGSNITITGVSAGSATLTAKATISGTVVTKTCAVTVTAASNPASIAISATSKSLVVGNTATINATSSDSSAITWSTSNSSVAKISSTSASSGSNITITGMAAGSATLTAKATINGTLVSKTCAVTVTAASNPGTTYTKTVNYSDTFSPALPTSSTTAKTSAYAHTDSTAGIAFKARGIYRASGASYIMFKSGTGYLYNTASLGEITSIAVTYSSGTSLSGKIGVYFASSAKSTYTTSSNIIIAGRSATNTFTSTAGYGYFQISTSAANVQITKIVITYIA
ncbi:MAG TPA: endonuclease [Bacilli bacterium]|nr:endonuclease [Bacilli bacterium]